MTIQQLKYALVISEAKSFNKAAETIYVSQPSLTAAIHDLEAELGITIFNRTSRGVTLTSEGQDFILNARELLRHWENVLEKYGDDGKRKKKFAISAQHYTFAIKSFVEMAKKINTDEYELAARETKTRDVIEDVASMKSELGVLYLSDFNRKVITNLLESKELEFNKLIDCGAYVYMWKKHPLAKKDRITFEELEPYPCLSFEQDEASEFYFAEEIFSERKHRRVIKVNDRGTILNMMVGLNGYTLCCGIISEELNGSDYVAVPFCDGAKENSPAMQIGWIKKKNLSLSAIGQCYVDEMKKYLASYKI